MTQNILAIADASRDGLQSMLGAFRMIKKGPSTIQIILLSFLSTLSEKDCVPLGPNTLFLLAQEENEIAKSLRNHLAKMNIRGNLRFITHPIWEDILEEIRTGNQDLVILQGRFLDIWDTRAKGPRFITHAINGLKCSILVIKQREETSLC